MYINSVKYVANSPAETVVLTDDANSLLLPHDLESAGVDFNKRNAIVGCLRPSPIGDIAKEIQNAHILQTGVEPGTYSGN